MGRGGHGRDDGVCYQISVLTIIVWLYLSSSVILFYPWLSGTNAWIICEAIFTVLTTMTLVFYLKAGYTDPGRTPDNYEPEGMYDDLGFMRKSQRAHKKEKQKELKSKLCTRCSTYKPPRSHHCSVCDRCVLKMDHHCPWVNNCVGYFNHRPFIQFLFYAVTGTLFQLILLVLRLIALASDARESGTVNPFVVIVLGVDILLALIVLIGVGMLFGFQVKSVARNLTTIETWTFENEERRARKMGKTLRHQWDLGTWTNLKMFFGTGNVLLWLLPSETIGDGITFKQYVAVEGEDGLLSDPVGGMEALEV